MSLKLYNTLGRKLADFTPLHDSVVGLYTCGPTVYNTAHIGNLRTYIFEDVLRRTLELDGYKVKHVMNITDVGHLTGDGDMGEDKIAKASRETKRNAYAIAKEYESQFFADLEQLNILPPTVKLRATETIGLQIDLIKKLETNGFTYRTSDGIYFDTAKLPSYGQLSGQKSSDKKAGARVEVNDEKKSPTDFALWKFSKPEYQRQMEWPSPWGVGFPGWHIECSAMSLSEFPDGLDIHCGGIDHIAVHHENEIAQNEASGHKDFVKFWMHGEFLRIDPMTAMGNQFANNIFDCPHCGTEVLITSNRGYSYSEIDGRVLMKITCTNKDCKKVFDGPFSVAKMAKSEGNSITLKDVTDKDIDPLAFRFLCLQADFQKPLSFTWESIQAAQSGLEGLWSNIVTWAEAPSSNITTNTDIAVERFISEMNNNLHTSGALNVLNTVRVSSYPESEKLRIFAEFDKVLGLQLNPSYARTKVRKNDTVDIDALPNSVQFLVTARNAARTKKDFPESDRLKKDLEALGYSVTDTPTGTQLRKT